MSDVSQAFAPVRAKLYTAPLGTSVSGITGTSVLAGAFEDHGAIDLSSGYTFSPAGTPTRTIEREFYDDAIFFASETPSDDVPTWDVTFMESNIVVIEDAFGATVDEDGKLDYVGGIPPHKVMVLDLADAAASPKTRRFLIPDTSIAINGSVNPSGSKKLEKYPLRFSGNPTAAFGGTVLFRMWSSWLVDLS
jgi:hypothetical protein